jgi:hypothetical protein
VSQKLEVETASLTFSVAKEMMNFFMDLGLTEQEARERFWLIDTKVSFMQTPPGIYRIQN